MSTVPYSVAKQKVTLAYHMGLDVFELTLNSVLVSPALMEKLLKRLEDLYRLAVKYDIDRSRAKNLLLRVVKTNHRYKMVPLEDALAIKALHEKEAQEARIETPLKNNVIPFPVRRG